MGNEPLNKIVYALDPLVVEGENITEKSAAVVGGAPFVKRHERAPSLAVTHERRDCCEAG